MLKIVEYLAVTSFGISDVKSVSHVVGSASTFTADTIQTELLNIGVSTISGFSGSGGISTISSINPQFPGQLKVKNLLKFSNQTSPDPVFAEVVSVGSSVVTVTGIQTVTGVVDGDLPADQLDPFLIFQLFRLILRELTMIHSLLNFQKRIFMRLI